MRPQLAVRSVGALPSLVLSLGLLGACSDEVVGTVTPAIRGEPERVDLAEAALGSLVEHEVRAVSVGSAALTVRSVTLVGQGGAAPSADLALALTDTLPKLLAPQQALSFRVQHLPRDAQLDTGAVRIESDDPATPVLEIPIVQAPLGAPVITAVPDLEAAKVEARTPGGVSTRVASLAFGQVDVGLRKTVSFHLVNVGSGNVALELLRARLVDPDAELTVVVDPVLPVSLPALAAQGLRPGTTLGARVEVSWAPSRTGQALMNVLRVESTDPATPSFDLPLTGNTQAVAPPVMRVEPAAGLDFGTVPVGGMAQRMFTIHNDGAGDLALDAPALSSTAAFGFASAPPPVSIAAGAMRAFTVVFRPGAAGSLSAVVRLRSNNAAVPPVDYPLRGSGVMACVPAMADPREPLNDDCATAIDRGTVQLAANQPGVATVNDGMLELMGDGDWNRFVMEVDIGCGAVIGYDARAEVQLPAGEQAEVCVRVGDCAAPLRQYCATTRAGGTVLGGANTLCQSTNNAVPVFVQVRHTGGEPTCQPYTLTFTAR